MKISIFMKKINSQKQEKEFQELNIMNFRIQKTIQLMEKVKNLIKQIKRKDREIKIYLFLK